MMHLKENDKILNYLIILVEVFVLACAAMSTVICLQHNVKEFMWLLPLVYGICFLGVIFKQNYVIDNVFILIIVGIFFIRDVITPVLFYCMNIAPWQLGWNALHYYELYNVTETIMIMVLEIIATFTAISVFGKKYTVVNVMEVENKIGRPLILVVIVASLMILVFEPWYSGIYDMIAQFYSYESSSYKAILLDVGIVLVALFMAIMIKRMNKVPDIIKLVMTGVVWLIFCAEASLGSNEFHPVSRWGFILNLLIGGIMLLQIYPKYKKAVIYTIGIVGIIGIAVMSIHRGFNTSKFFCYVNFNDYFAGPTNMSFVVDMCRSENHEITFRTFLGDVFANVPIINHFLKGQDNTVYYFCHTIFGTTAEDYYRVYDKIVPLTGQMYTYMSYVGVVFGNVLLTYLALVVGYWAKRVNDLYLRYGMLFIAIIFSLGTIFNLNIIFQYLSITIFPVMFVVILDMITVKIIEKVCGGR